ncbi:non-ribosomal peptide synthase/polyketide synthase [Nocardia sp. NBC_01503]|uniref:non-ribosomal peptide synthase/polyketide synthase n=1 Tax=Nocardia sp. NBC_01503 TaxID=2975997 RepID=UPI002E7BFA5C|nr:non-ribosomal peptide synthase/polyketide synthase [Nocardia sp. NBC_01503]WTL35392.1 non-ribosomal peptide synthase/polyketide synthase [Nocardia sp. NBC_01503]
MQGTELGGFGPGSDRAVGSAPTPEAFELTPGQLGLWYAQLLDPDVPINVAQYLDVHGDLDAAAVERASGDAIREFQAVVVRLIEVDGQPRQIVDPTLPVAVPYLDLRENADPEAAAREWMHADFSAPVDLLHDRLFAGAVLHVGEQRYFFYLRCHHILLDGYGALTITMRIAERYNTLVTGGTPATIDPGEMTVLVESEQRYRASAEFEADRRYWADRVHGLEATTLDRRTAPAAPANLRFGRQLPQRVLDRINQVARERDSKTAVVLLAAFGAYLARLTDQREVVLSLPVTARIDEYTRRSAGMLSNIVPLRLAVGDDATWDDVLAGTRLELSNALRHQRYRHEDIRRDADREGQQTRRALFGPLANFMLFDLALPLAAATARYNVLTTGPVEDLSLQVYYADSDQVHLELEANPNLYGSDDLARHHARFTGFLERLLELDPATPLGAVPVITELEREVSLRIWNDTARDPADFEPPVAAESTLVSLFAAQAARTPGAVALRYAGEPAVQLTYAELSARVNRLARHLISLGVGPETMVALHLRRSPELVTALYAVQAAGAAYVPLDPDHPADRTAHIVATARPAVVLTSAADRPAVGFEAPVLVLDELVLDSWSGAPLRSTELLAPLRPSNTAYVIFTSGSTGLPKGVAVTHRGIVNRLAWMQSEYGLNSDDVVLQKTPATFDVSVWEFFWPLQIGATLVVATPDGHRDPGYLAETIVRERVTVAHFVPAMLAVFLGELVAASAREMRLRMVFASGEALPAATAQRLRALTGARLHNLYGPTEAAVDVTFHEVTDLDTEVVPIGAPVSNTRLYVLDSRLRPVPVGTPGELYLSGVQLARGYVARPGLTAERFVADPFAGPDGLSDAGELMYRTGDLVRWTAQGELVYLERTDFQVKLRGLRIELGEIETVLTAQDYVHQAVVVVRDEQLVAYLVPARGSAAVDVASSRVAAAATLPSYMVPSAYVVLDALPLNASGKLDRRALPAPEPTVTVYRAPVSVVEQSVARVFGEVLERDGLGLDDDFFALGGNSLIATRVAARISGDLGCRIGVRELFGAPTVAAVAELIERQFLDEDAEFGTAVPELAVRERPEVLPLSPAQQRIWFLNRFATGSADYNMPFVLRLRGDLDVAAMRAAIADLVGRHEVLRTVFPQTADGPCQRVLPAAALSPRAALESLADQLLTDAAVAEFDAAELRLIAGTDLVAAAEPIAAADLDAELRAFASRGFDLETEIPFRARLFDIQDTDNADNSDNSDNSGEADFALSVVLHHIAADGLSLPVLARDLVAAYTARLAGHAPGWTPLPLQYADYALWQRERLGAATDPNSLLAQQLEYWTRTLAGAPEQLDLPSDRPRPAVASGLGGTHQLEIPAGLHSRLLETAQEHGVSAFMLLHAVLAVLLARLSGGDDIVIGTPVGGRGERDLDELIGMFVGTLPLRTQIDTRATFAELLSAVRESDLAAFAHADVPFEQLVETLNPARSQARHPVFQVTLSFTGVGNVGVELPGLLATAGTLDTGVAKFDLSIAVTESFAGAGPGEGPAPAGIQAEFAFATDLFDSASISVLAARFLRLLDAVTAAPATVVADLPLLSPREYANLTTRSGGPATATGLLPDVLAEAAEADPDDIAICDERRAVTYAELDAASSRLARLLIDRGIGPDDLVAIGVPRSIEQVTAVWAVIKSGAGWLPVDPAYPVDRITHMVTDSRAVLGLTTAAARAALPGPLPWLLLDDPEFRSACAAFADDQITDADRVRPLHAQHIAYAIYTSGSTGLPKGVLVTHESLVSLAAEQTAHYFGHPGARVLSVASPSFDISVAELLLAVNSGATLVIAPAGATVGQELSDFARAQRVTHLAMTPSAAASLDPAELPDVQSVAVGGEAVPAELVRRWVEAGRTIVDAYGPTETTVIVNMSQPLRAGEPVHVGRPIRGVREWVLDGALQPVPVGATGELYVAGPQLARGYHGRPELTANRFVACPWAPGERMYRTGDLVRWAADGSVIYVGRNDSQVKVRGYRIELGEIESALAAHEQVRQAVVIVHGDAVRGDQLAAYLVPADPAAGVRTEVVRASLQGRLAPHMVPAAFTVIAELPMTPNGKLNHRALPAPEFAAREFRALSTSAERLVAAAFTEVLGSGTPIGADDDFFELGGNSLIATRLTARLGAALDARVPVRLIFDARTVAELAAALGEFAGTGGRPPLVAGERPAQVPLSYAQQRMWFLNRFDTESVADNLVAAIRLSGPLDRDALAAALGDVIERHETLRTIYPATDGIGRQQVLPVAAAAVGLITEEITAAELDARIRALAGTPFAVDAEVPLRLNLLRVDDTEHLLVFSVHHIAADGWSVAPLTFDVMAAYSARLRGAAPRWAALPVQYADYALWQRELLGAAEEPDSLLSQQISFWRNELSGLAPELSLPLDRPRPATASGRGARYEFALDAGLHERLRAIAERSNASLFMVVHAAFAALLAKLSGQSDVAIGTPVAGRGEAALDGLVGMFVNTLALRTEVAPRGSFTDLVTAVRDADLRAFANADVPFERLVEALNPVRTPGLHPLFQVVLDFQNTAGAALELEGLEVSRLDIDTHTAKFDLQLSIGESADGGLAAVFTYATDLFDAEAIEALARRFARVVTAVASDAALPVGDIEVLDADERQRVLYDWPATGVDGSESDTLAARFAAAALIDPLAPAVRSGDLTLTYGELDARSNRLARRLIAAGVGPESLVAVALPRTADLVVALLAVLKSGGGYLPIDPNYPADRIEYVLDDARPVCALTSAAANLPAGWFGGPVLDLDAIDLTGYADTPVTDADRRGTLDPAHTAYVIYTSGSTGRPKGVLIPHLNVVRLLDNTQRHFAFGPSDVWTMFHSYAFDFSVWELWGPLLSGGSVVVVDYFTSRSPQQFRELLAAERVTVLNQTPSAFYQLIAADLAHAEDDLALRCVIFGGEALEPQRLRDWFARHPQSPALVNMYGITETTVHVSYRPITPTTGSASVIGGALPGLVVRVLDSRLRPVPAGVPGEIYVSGGQLARGYLSRPALSASRFVADPYGPAGTVAYRTGDLARWTATGELEYLGRADQQVNLRGFRVELGEIEAALLDERGVREAAVVVRHDDIVAEDRIVGYVVADTSVDTALLRQGVARRLPEHMVPTAIVVIDRIPLTVNGKLDRAALPAPTFEAAAYREPGTPAEIAVANVFAELLGIDRVGVDDDFFALGGSSLLAARAVARIGAALDCEIPVRVLFETRSVAALAEYAHELSGAGARKALLPRMRPERLPLALAQQRMWFLNRYWAAEETSGPGAAADNIPLVIRFSGALDVVALAGALADLVQRHETLRTIYPDGVDGPEQVILTAAQSVPAVVAEQIDESELDARLVAAATYGFDLTGETPLRTALFRLSGTEHVLALVLHHISADGYSLGPLALDLMAAYTARHTGRAPAWQPLPVQYADYALWQAEVLGSDTDPNSEAARQLSYWQHRLAGLPEQLDLPADRPRPAVSTQRGGAHHFTVDAHLHGELAALAQKLDTTMFSTVHAALAILLSRLSGSTDIAIGTPVAGRGEQALDGLVGMFVNTLVLRTEVDPRAAFETLLAQVRAGDIEALSHTDIPFERLVEVLAPARAQNRHPLFQVALTFQNFPLPALELPGLRVLPAQIEAGIAKFDLQFTVTESFGPEGRTGGLEIEITYATDLFDADSIALLARRFEQVLATVASDHLIAVGDIDLLRADERRRVLTEWNATARDLTAELPEGAAANLVSLFEAQVRATPEAIALVFEGASLSYAEFAGRVHRTARHLIAQGIGAESTVALAIRRSVDLVVAMYAVLEAGGAYVPLDPDQPADRIDYVLDTARPAAILTTARDAFTTGGNTPVLEVDTLDLEGCSAAPITDSERGQSIRPDHTAYVIFTSGSTGRPKGVAVEHGAIVNRLLWMQHEYPIDASDAVLQKTPATFDVSVWEFFWPLQTGARLVVAKPDGHRDPVYLAQVIAEEGITTAHFVPSMLSVFVAESEAARCTALRQVFASGEALPAATAQRLRELTGARLHNLYGPTEAAVDVTYHEVVDADTLSVPIGRPVWNTRAYVLDARLNPVAPGVAGELYLAGDQLARGYLGRPDLSADRFVANPFATTGARLYRTGDLVKWNADGEVEYLGRTDFQVKLRGLRIELGEIESALIAMDSVDRAVVVVRADELLGDQLVAYLVPAAESVEIDEVRAGLSAALPGYMVPAAFVVLDAFPLNASGKLDRRALPAPVFEAKVFRAPSTPVEQIVAGIFADLLGAERIGVDDDFFELGGSSLLAAKAVARIGTALDTNVGVRALFEASAVGQLAARVEVAPSGSRPALVAGARPEQLPLSPAQQRMWFLNRFDGSSTAYTIPLALRLSGDLDVTALRAAVAEVVERHETLRTIYPETASGPVQVVLPADRAAQPLLPIDCTEAELPQRILALTGAGFDVTTEVPVRLRLFRITDAGPGEYVFVGALHHISADGSSLVPFVRDLMLAYGAHLAGAAPAWSPMVAQYADYALWQRALLGSEADAESVAAQQLSFWRTALTGLPDQLDLPTDFPRPARQSLRGKRVELPVDAELHARLIRVGRGHGATLFMVVHAAFAALLGRLSGAADITVGTPIAGRGEAALDDIIGMFVNTLVLRTEIDAAEPFSDLLGRVRTADIAAFAHADVPFERLVEVLNPARSTARHPLFQVGFSFQNHERAALELPGLTVSEVDFDNEIAQFDLHLFAVDHYGPAGAPAGMALTLGYATDLFTEDTALRFAAALRRMLETVAAEPDTTVGAIDLLGRDLREQVLTEWNATERALAPVTLVDLVDSQVAATPEAVALLSADGEISLGYAEFDARVNRLARRLIADGVGPEQTVVLAIRRSIDLVIAMYAVVKSGAAYVPIDPDHPADRIAYIIETAAPAVILTTTGDDSRRHPGALSAGIHSNAISMLRIDELDLSAYPAAPIRDGERVRPLRPHNPAYLIFTSGSTGKPKGVAVPHAAIANQLQWLQTTFELDANDRALLKTPATFDLSVWEFWSLLTTGGSLVVTAPGDERDPDRLRALMETHAVTVLHPVPSLLGMLLTSGALPASVRAVLAIGEALPAATATEFLDNPGKARLFNLYGPTEAAVSITACEVTERSEQAISIGTPAWNSGAYVLDARLQPVLIGVPGELYLSGAQLARGYHGRPALTADRFIANPFGAGRLYRTGDIVRRRADGSLEYVDRADFQVKIGGFRIELGEVETALRRRDGVTAAVAVARADGNGSRLVAYAAVPGADPARHEETAAALRTALAAELPQYMVPAALVVLEALPLNANGKVDRARLPEPAFAAAVYRAPVSRVEHLIAAAFAEVIDIDTETVGLDADFFALGGNSLMATRLAARLGADLGVRVPVAAVFEAPTVLALAERLAAIDPSDVRPALVRRTTETPAPLSLSQQRMWVVNRLTPGSGAYNVPAAIRLRSVDPRVGALDQAALAAALRDLVQRHEILRTRYPEVDGEAVQQVLPADEVRFDLTPMAPNGADLDDRIAEIVSAGFDVTVAPPVRVALLEVSAAEHVLVVVMHHISTDGYSVAPMARDLVRAYTSRLAGSAPEWTPLAIQYGDYSAWQRTVLGAEADPDSLLNTQLGFWRSELAGLPEQLPLPTDRPRPARREMRGDTIEFEIEADLTERLTAVAREHNATLFGVLHSAFAVLLSKLSGLSDIAIGAPVAGRGERALDDLIGMFVNTVVLRAEVDARAPFHELLRQVRDRDLAALAQADIPFERVVEAVLSASGRARSTAYTPLFQVMFTFQNMNTGTVTLPGLEVEVLEPRLTEAKFDLQLTALEQYDPQGRVTGLRMQFAYATDIFEAATIRLLAERLRCVLDAIAADPAVAVRAIDIRTDSERPRSGNSGPASTPAPGASARPEGAERTPAEVPAAELPALIAAAAELAPDAVAVTHGAHNVTYRDLAAKIATVARAMGAAAKPEALVNVALAGLVPGILAALGAGGLSQVLHTLSGAAQALVQSEGDL